LLIGCLLSLSGCVTYNYFLSPLNANQNPYQAIPLKSDSIKGATYATVVATVGGANDAFRDDQFSFRGSVHRSNTFGNLHVFYGGSLAFGSYDAKGSDFNSPSYSGNNTTVSVNVPGQNMFFGAASMTGGMNIVITTPGGGEWRVIGLETSVNREFGDYLAFRKNLPDSFNYVIDRNAWTGTLGFTTEIIGKQKSGGSFGYKFAFGFGFNRFSNYNQYPNNYSTSMPVYATHTLHFTRGKWTGFGQFNVGYKAFSLQFGAAIMLGKNSH
jgi:hypothetical protein